MRINPVIEKELRTKMRGWRAPALITAYLGFLGLIVCLFFLSARNSYNNGGNVFNPREALEVFNVLAFLQFGMLLMIAPAMTGAAVSSERERQTLDLLLCTNLSTLSIIKGKIFVSLAHVLLLIVASLPILSMVFLFGGIGLLDIGMLFLFYVVTALFLGSLGIFFSTFFKKSIVAIVVTYISVFAFTIGTFIVFGFASILFFNFNQPSYWEVSMFLFSNPIYGFGSVLVGDSRSFMGLFSTGFYGSGMLQDHWLKPWMINMGFDVAASVALIWASAWRLKPVK